MFFGMIPHEIATLNPHNVLETGCGYGVLDARFAPDCGAATAVAPFQ